MSITEFSIRLTPLKHIPTTLKPRHSGNSCDNDIDVVENTSDDNIENNDDDYIDIVGYSSGDDIDVVEDTSDDKNKNKKKVIENNDDDYIDVVGYSSGDDIDVIGKFNTSDDNVNGVLCKCTFCVNIQSLKVNMSTSVISCFSTFYRLHPYFNIIFKCTSLVGFCYSIWLYCTCVAVPLN